MSDGDGVRRASRYAAVVTMLGIDAGADSHWAWHWSDDGDPGSRSVRTTELAAALGRLDDALPGARPGERAIGTAVLRARIRQWDTPELRAVAERETDDGRLRELAMAHRCVTGALADPVQERALALELGDLLLPTALLERLRRFPAGDVLFRVLPASSCIRVPWELLAVGDDDTRLVEIADVETMAPLLSRDGDASVPHPSWEDARRAERLPLHIIDPVSRSGQVLSREQAGRWPRSVHAGGSVQRRTVTRAWLSERLLASPPPSRLFYVGHVVPGRGTAPTTGLLLSSLDADMYGTTGTRALTAQDLLAGTVSAPTDTPPHAVPAAAVAAGAVTAVPGAALWPMPPRVALIACQSGTDLGHAEPFGLVTAVLELGAELVTATRWPLLTDEVFRFDDATTQARTPFTDLALAVDEFHDTDDPISALNLWQRESLDRWRAEPSWANSPLTWAAVTTHHAPDRTDRAVLAPPIP